MTKLRPFWSGSIDNHEPEIETKSESLLENNLPLQKSIIIVTNNEMRDVESQTLQTDTGEINCLLE